MGKRKKSTFERLTRGRLNRKQRRELERRLCSNDPGLEVVHANAAGIDVGNESHFVAVAPGRDPEPVREFGSWTMDLERLAHWLKSCGVETVALQATGVYWIALYDVLEQHGMQVYLVNARDTKNLPGRKSDVQESQWLLKLHTYGLLRNSFRPPDEIRCIRTIWRWRDRLVKDAGRHIKHMQKALTTMNVQLANVISDVSGVTGQAVIRAILKGERDPYRLADLRDTRVQASREEMARSLEGNWREDVLFELKQAVDAYDFAQKQIRECDQQLQKYLAILPTQSQAGTDGPKDNSAKRTSHRSRKPKGNMPRFDLQPELKRICGADLTSIDGMDVVTALTILSEIGTTVSQWTDEQHFVSWAGLTPNRDISGGKVIRQRRRPGNNRVGTALRLAASSLLRSQTYLGARFRALRTRLGAPKAIKAMARYLGCLVYRMLTHGQDWVDQGAQAFERKNHQRTISLLQRKAAALGFQLLPVPTNP